MLRHLLLPLLLVSGALADDPVVQTEYGAVEGFYHDEAEIYLGIPFAKPPLKELRFANPVPPEPWTETRPAKNFSDACVPHSAEAAVGKASEDCLYLNVIAPNRESSSSLAPVLFYIHGGGYEIGNARIYGYEDFAEIYATQGVVVVSIQYRLGVMGFFSLADSKTMKGNYGLFDQVMALEFVHRNIEKFGGDPNRITVFGISAGGSSASALTISPLTRHLIKGSIEVSGTAHAGWAIDNRVEKHSEDLIDAVGCWGKRTLEDTEECMRRQTVKQIYGGVEVMFESAFSFNMLKFAPKIDGVFAPARPEELVKDAPNIPVLTGINELESAFFILMNRSPTIHRSVIFKGEMPLLNIDKFDMKIRILLNEFLEEWETDGAVQDVMDFYFGEGQREKYKEPTWDEIKFLLRKYNEFWSDIYFNLPARYRADERKEIGADSYVYVFEHFSPEIFKDDDPVHASVHINEMPYIIGTQPIAKFNWTETEKKVADKSRQMMISFIKEGKPTVDGVLWPSYSSNDNAPFVRIASPEWKSEEKFWEKNHLFWRDVMSKYSYDFVRFKKVAVPQMQIPAPPTEKHEEL